MSSYRSYVPWKSNLQTSYKSGSSSAYSSRDDISGSRYGSLSTPTTYRPSFSGGTYRVKRDPPVTQYTSRYATTPTTSISSKDDKDKSIDSSRTIQQQKYLGNPSNTSNKENKVSPSRYSTSTSNMSKYGRRSRDPSPTQETHRPTSSLAATRIKSREPSPATRTLRGKSRDPSPAIDTKSKLASTYGSSYRMSGRNSSSSGYSSRYGHSPSMSRQSTTSLDKAISYLSVSDFRARSVSRAKEIAERKSYDKEVEKETVIDKKEVVESSESKETSPEEDEAEEESSSDNTSEEIFVPVLVCTRGTSPTPPSASTVVRTRRVELAKTIEKTIQRSSKRPKMLDKEIQSDRLDDSTRYSRFGLSSRVSSYTPHESRYTPSLRYSSSISPLTKSSRSESRTDMSDRKDDSKSKSPETKTSTGASPKSKLSPPKNGRMSSRQASVENLSASSKISPETEGVVKTSLTVAKLPNKDFRKSALNVGPTDRPRKSRTPSTSTDSDEKLDGKKISPPTGTTQFLQRQEKSPGSSSSETNTTSPKSSLKKKLLNAESKIRQRCHAAKPSSSTSSSSSSSPSPSAKINVNNVTEYKSRGRSESSPDNRKLKNRPTESPPPTAETTSPRETGASDALNENSSQNRRQQPPVASDDDTVLVINKENKIGTSESLGSPQTSADGEAFANRSQDESTDVKTNLLEKLGSISNFFAARQHDTNSEPLYVDRRSSESTSGDSISSDLKQSVSKTTTTTTTVPLTELNANRATSIEFNTNSTTSPSTASITAPPSTEPTTTEDCYDTSSSWWQDNTSQQISTTSALDIKDDMRYRLRHIDSGEVGWWLKNDEDDTLADDLRTLNQDDEEDGGDLTDQSPHPQNQIDESWWEKQNESIKLNPKVNDQGSWQRIADETPTFTFACPKQYSQESGARLSDSPKKSPETLQNGIIKLNICRVESGERPWWLEEEKSTNLTTPKEQSPSKRPLNSNGVQLDRSPSNGNFACDKPWWMSGPAKKLFNIRHVESGERPAWLESDESPPRRVENNLKESDEDAEDDSESDDEVLVATTNMMERLPPLGDRASPDGLEDPSRHRKSPYENIPMMKAQAECNGVNGFNAQKLFISRHTNIDELLGGSCRPLSPLIDRYSAKNVFLEEITPDQVRIHDSTAQMPVIQRIERDEWDYGSPKVQPPWVSLKIKVFFFFVKR